jgi:hypothetical protein
LDAAQLFDCLLANTCEGGDNHDVSCMLLLLLLLLLLLC